jgi:small glutamine-rich tetratricopeptide repeat-containing protein alpha
MMMTGLGTGSNNAHFILYSTTLVDLKNLSEMSSEASDEGRRLAYSMVQFLDAQKSKMNDKSEDLEASIQHISAAFGFDPSDPSVFKSESMYPTELKEIFTAGVGALNASVYDEKVEKASQVANFGAFVDTVAKKGYFEGAAEGSVEYLKRHAKVVAKFQNKADSAKAAKASPDQTALADEKKAEGNALLAKKKFKEAIACYTEAIALSPKGPSSHIFYCNRAAARCHIQEYKEAIVDCENSIECKNDYAKAYSRLGLAHFFLKEYTQSITAYEECLRLDPSNKSVIDSLEQAKSAKAKEQSVADRAPPAPSGMPDLSALAGMMGGAGGGAGGGGMPDIASLMQNPQMMSMAQEMMKNPAMMQQAMSMMGGMGGGGGGGAGGMPDMSALAGMMGGMGGGGGGGAGGMPDMSALAGMMGGMGGGAGGGSGNGIPDFSGFNEDEK